MFNERVGSGYLDLFAVSKQKALSLPTALTLGINAVLSKENGKKIAKDLPVV